MEDCSVKEVGYTQPEVGEFSGDSGAWMRHWLPGVGLVGSAELWISQQSLGIWVARKPCFLARILHLMSLLFKCIILFHIMWELETKGLGSFVKLVFWL